MSCIIINENNLTIKIIKTGKKHVIILIMSLKYIRRFVILNKVLLYITILRLLRLVFFISFLVDSESDNNDNF